MCEIPRRTEVQITGAMALLRKRWASLIAWVAAMDYSAADYTNGRISRLERDVRQLKDELRRTDPHVCRSRRRRRQTKCTVRGTAMTGDTLS